MKPPLSSYSDLNKRRPELDGLRALAILLVIYHHYIGMSVLIPQGTLPAYAFAVARLAWSGVDLFFVLSGYLIGGILIDNREATSYFKVFYVRRACRILPLYLLVLIIFWLAQGNGQVFNNPAPWYTYATFTQNLWMARSASFYAVWLAGTWSLAVEEQFYFTLPAIIRFVSERHLPYVLLACVGAAPLIRTAFYLLLPHAGIACYVLLPCRMDSLMLGVLAAWAVRKGIRVPRKILYIAFLIFGVGMLALTFKAPDQSSPLMMIMGYTWLALFYLTILLIVVSGGFRLFRIRPMTSVGLLAYGLYLYQPLNWLVHGGWPVIADLEGALRTVVSLALLFALAKLSWQLIEKPLIRIGHRYKYFSRTTLVELRTQPSVAIE